MDSSGVFIAAICIQSPVVTSTAGFVEAGIYSATPFVNVGLRQGTNSVSDWSSLSLLNTTFTSNPCSPLQSVPYVYIAAVKLQMTWERIDKLSDLAVVLKVNRDRFQCQPTEEPNATIRFPGLPRPVSVVTQAVASTTIATVSAVGAGTGGGAGAALQQTRAAMILSLGACQFDHYSPLGIDQSPTGWKLGEAKGAYYRGCALGNWVMFWGFVAFHFFLGFVTWRYRRGRLSKREKEKFTVWVGLGVVRFPALLLVPMMFLLPGLVSCSVALANHGSANDDLVWAIVSLLLLIPIVGFMSFQMIWRFDATFVTMPRTQQHQMSKVAIFFMGVSKWRTGLRDHFRQHYSLWYWDYRHPCQKQVIFDVGMVIFSSVLDGVKPRTDWGCSTLIALYAISGLLLAFVLLYTHPFIAGWNLLQAVLSVFLSLIAVVIMIVVQNGNELTDESREKLMSVTGSLAMSMVGLGIIKLILDIAFIWPKYTRIIKEEVKTVFEGSLLALRGDGQSPDSKSEDIELRCLDDTIEGAGAPEEVILLSVEQKRRASINQQVELDIELDEPGADSLVFAEYDPLPATSDFPRPKILPPPPRELRKIPDVYAGLSKKEKKLQLKVDSAIERFLSKKADERRSPVSETDIL